MALRAHMCQSFEKEYEHAQKELLEVRTCITEYIKMFFAAAGVVIGIIWAIPSSYYSSGGCSSYIYRTICEVFAKDTLNTINSIKDIDLRYACAFISYLILAFTLVLFHKFRTHNRYCGYLCAMQSESVISSNMCATCTTCTRHIHIWELTLNEMYRKQSIYPTLLKLCTRSEGESSDDRYTIDVEVIRKFLNKDPSKLNRSHGAKSFIDIAPMSIDYISRIVLGFVMMLRVSVKKVPTESWTYPYVIAFPLLVLTIFMVVPWGLMIRDSIIFVSPELVINDLLDLGKWNAAKEASRKLVDYRVVLTNLVLISYVILSWVGMASRMYRLCGEKGDRTIMMYYFRSMVIRSDILNNMGITVKYLMPKSKINI